MSGIFGGTSTAVTVETIRQAAADLIPHVIAERAEKLAEFKQRHEADKASYKFECKRHGEFLAVFITRGPAPKRTRYASSDGRTTNKFAGAINLATSRVFRIKPGSAPACDGVVTLQHQGGGKVAEIYNADQNWHTPYRMILVDAQVAAQHAQYMGPYHQDPLSNMHVQDCPRAAVDDEIYFTGPDITLYAPAGLGQTVQDTILAALET